MKKAAFAFLASLFVLASCGKKSDEDHHTHEDGTTHTDHSADTTMQEEFTIPDSTDHHHHDSADHQHAH